MDGITQFQNYPRQLQAYTDKQSGFTAPKAGPEVSAHGLSNPKPTPNEVHSLDGDTVTLSQMARNLQNQQVSKEFAGTPIDVARQILKDVIQNYSGQTGSKQEFAVAVKQEMSDRLNEKSDSMLSSPSNLQDLPVDFRDEVEQLAFHFQVHALVSTGLDNWIAGD